MSVHGIMSTVILTELINALRKDGIQMPDKVGPNTSKYIRDLAKDLIPPSVQEDQPTRMPASAPSYIPSDPLAFKDVQSEDSLTCPECHRNSFTQITDTLHECTECGAMLRKE